MSLSKVYRPQDFGSLQQFHYASFDHPEETPQPVSPPKAGQPAQAKPAVQAVASNAEEAFSRGRQAGLKEAEERFEKSVQSLAKGLEEVSHLRESILTNSSRDMLRLVLSIARQVIHREVTVDPEIVLSTIDMALQAAVESDSFTVCVHPDDLAVVEERKPLFLASIKGLQNIYVKASPDIERGGCLVESQLGEVDATIAGQLEEVRKTLLGALED